MLRGMQSGVNCSTIGNIGRQLAYVGGTDPGLLHLWVLLTELFMSAMEEPMITSPFSLHVCILLPI